MNTRRVRGARGLRVLGKLVRMAFDPRMLTRRAAVAAVWYESDRGQDDDARASLFVRAANGVLLVLTLAVITGPLWELVPWSLTPRSGLVGRVRLALAVASCHVAMVLWPCSVYLARNLFGQRRWAERVKAVALTALCVWLAWGATPVVAWFWYGLWAEPLAWPL